MIRYLLAGIVLLGAVGPSSGQPRPKTNAAAAQVLLTFPGGYTVTREAFELSYAKSYGRPGTPQYRAQDHSARKYQAYLDSFYVPVTRRYLDALAQRLDTLGEYQREREELITPLTQRYALERAVEEPFLAQARQRREQEVRARHLMLSLPRDAAPADTLRAYNRLQAVRDSLLEPGTQGLEERFSAAARTLSADVGSGTNGGDLGYFSVFEMVGPFEQVAFTAPVGSISQPVRTRFGYHLVYVADRRARPELTTVAHLVSTDDRNNGADNARQRADSLYAALQQGADWATLVSRYSNDPRSAAQGGDLGTSRLLPEMEAFKRTAALGAYSQPLRSPVGWHILKLTGRISASQALNEEELRRRMAVDEQLVNARRKYLDGLFVKYGVTTDTAAARALTLALQAWPRRITTTGADSLPPQAQALRLATAQWGATTGRDFMQWCLGNNRALGGGADTDRQTLAWLRDLLQQQALIAEANQNPEFRALRDEIAQGLLIFRRLEQRVLRPATEDTAALRRYYESHLSDYRRPARARIYTFAGKDSATVARAVQAYDAAGNDEDRRLAALAQRPAGTELLENVMDYPSGSAPAGLPWAALGLNGTAPAGVQPNRQTQRYEAYRLLAWEQAPQQVNGQTRYSYTPPLGQIQAQVARDYQQLLEQGWNRELAQQYPVTINKRALQQLFKP